MSKGAGQKFALVGHGMNKEGVTEWLQTGMEVINTSLAEGKPLPQAVEESVKTLFSKKGAESYLMGAIASGAAIGGGRILKGLVSDKSKKKASEAIQLIEQQQEELSNPDLSNESRVFIWDNIQNNVTQLVSAVDEDVDTAEGLSAEQRKNITILNDKISSLEVVANDPAASEETKSRALESIKGIQETIDDITSRKVEAPDVPQPTFDTEESIGEEVRESNKKFQAGEIDQATWEQEQKDLNKRAENIIPVPEDAEIGKPEEVVSEDIETKKAEIDSLQEEIDLLVPEQNRLVEIVNNEDRRVGQPQSENEIKLNEIINKSSSLVDERNAIEEELAELEQQTKPKEDAVQKQAAGQVPVLTEAKAGEEVEQGKPEAKPKVVAEEGVKAEEVTPAQQVEQLRADEQAELKTALPNAEQYLTDGKVDRTKITDAKDLKKFDEIYDRYDKLITPLLPKKEAPAKAKPLPKPRVATRLAFKKAVDLFYDISGTEGSSKKRTLSAKRKTFLEQNPSIKYIDDNWKDISKQLEEKGLITKKSNCP